MIEKPCPHPTEKAQYLTTYEQTHLDEPDIKAMLACVFLCTECGKIYAAHVEAVRGPNKMGEIPQGLRDFITKRKSDMEVQNRARDIAAQIIREQKAVAPKEKTDDK